MKKSICGVLAAVALFAAVEAKALSYSFDLYDSGSSAGGWATVTLSDSTYTDAAQKVYDAVHIVVNPLEDAFASPRNLGIRDFYFNENTGGHSADIRAKLVGPATGILAFSSTSDCGDGNSPYGKFEFMYSSTGNSRAYPLDFYLYTVNPDFDIQASQFVDASSKTDYLFAAEMVYNDGSGNLYSSECMTRGEAQPVPEPGTVALLGLGLACLAICKRRSLL